MMNTRKLINKMVPKKINKKWMSIYDYALRDYVNFKIEIISIDLVNLKSFQELNDLGELYINNKYPFLCLTNLPVSLNRYVKLATDYCFKKPIVVFIITLVIEDNLNNENLLSIILPKNSKKSSSRFLLESLKCKIDNKIIEVG